MIWSLFFFMSIFLRSKPFFFFNMFFNLDTFSIFMICVLPLVFRLITFFSFSWLGRLDKLKFIFMFLCLCRLVLLCFVSCRPVFYLAGLELTILPISLLIFVYSKDYDKILSIFFMFIMNLAGSLPFMLFCASYLNNLVTSISIFHSFRIFRYDSLVLWVCMVFILISKLPFFMLHFWLTKAHVRASGASSIILASLILKLGSFGLFKFCSRFSSVVKIILTPLVAVSLISILFMSTVIIRFFDLKYFVACSSIVHMSLMFPLLCMFRGLSIIGRMLMMVGHGLISYMLFFLVSFFYEVSLNRSSDFNKSLESLFKSFSLFLFLFVLLNLGLPPFIRFFRELFFAAWLNFYSFYSFLFFAVSIITFIIFVIFVVSKSLFGKKGYVVRATPVASFIVFNFRFLNFVLILVFFC